jgi:hypothetical protein
VRFFGIGTNAQHNKAFTDELTVIIAQAACFCSTSGSIVLGVEIQYNLLAQVVADTNKIALLVSAFKQRSRHPFCGLIHDFFVFLFRLVKV